MAVVANARMKIYRPKNLFITFLLATLCFLPACGDDPHGCYSVEIAPGKFVPVKFTTWNPHKMTVYYNGTAIKYPGYDGLNRPKTLMEFDGKLYVLALEARRSQGRDQWKYIAFRQEGNKFERIPEKDFPRSIAIFNLWRPGDPTRYSTGAGGVKIDAAKIARELNPDDVYFVNSYQARLWYMLEVTNSLYASERDYSVYEGKKFLQDYIEKYKPVRLTSMEMKALPKGQCK